LISVSASPLTALEELTALHQTPSLNSPTFSSKRQEGKQRGRTGEKRGGIKKRKRTDKKGKGRKRKGRRAPPPPIGINFLVTPLRLVSSYLLSFVPLIADDTQYTITQWLSAQGAKLDSATDSS